MRVAIVYDCLFPYTVGGAERWYRGLAERLASRHQVTYLTRLQWSGAAPPDPPTGAAVIAVSGGGSLYESSGRRAIVPPLRFGLGVFRHLIRNRRSYDVVHTCAFPYFSMLAARAARALGGPPVVTDWFEVWPREYWRSYLGAVRGAMGEAVQRICIRLSRRVFVFSELYARELRAQGSRVDPVVLRGMYDGPAQPLDSPDEREPVVIFAGRHIREKGVIAIPPAILVARRTIPGLRATIFGDGPQRAALLAEVARLGLAGVIECPGFRPWNEIDRAMRRAMCLLLPSAREGYGLVVVEAAARGTPSIVLRAPASAAIELIEEGINGLIARNADPNALAEAIVRLHRAGPAMVRSTRTWFAANAGRLSIDASVGQIERVYQSMVQRRLTSL